MEEKVKVIFRVDREGVVFALFPELPYDPAGRYCTSYEHSGHSGADYRGCIWASRPAKPEESKDLSEELERIGYNLDERKRYNRR